MAGQFKLISKLPLNGTIVTLSDAPARYQCQVTGHLSEKRVGIPGFVITGAKPSSGNSAIRGCFANWNVAWRYLLHHKDEIGQEAFDRIQSWLVETALQGLSEEVKRTFQPSPRLELMKLHGGELSPEQYVRAVPAFTSHAIDIRDEIAKRDEKKSEKPAATPRRDFRTVVTEAAAEFPDQYSSFTVGFVPSLSYWYVNGNDGDDDGREKVNKLVDGRVPCADQQAVFEFGWPDRLSKRQQLLAASLAASEKRPAVAAKPDGKKRSKLPGREKSEKKRSRKHEPLTKPALSFVD